MSSIIRLDPPITIKEDVNEYVIDTVDKSKVEKGLFRISESINLIENGTKERGVFVTDIYYKEDIDNLVISSAIHDNSNTLRSFEYIYTLTEEEITNIFREVIEKDTKIFEIDFVKEKVSQAKDELFKTALNNNKIIIFKNREIDILYGTIDDQYIFNRICFEDENCIALGEVLLYNEDTENKDKTVKIKLYLENNISITIMLYATMSFQKTENISYVFLVANYKENQEYSLEKERTNKKFNVDKNVSLPYLNGAFQLEFLYEANTIEEIDSIYESNKNFFVSNINIYQYLLG